MAIKSTLISTVNSFYTILVTMAKVKSSLLEMINNFYGTVVNDTQLTTNILTADSATEKLYDIDIVKQGRYVHLKGTITKASMGIIELETWLSITDSEYLPNDFHYFWGHLNNDTPIRFTLNSVGDLILVTPLGASETVYISTTYNTLE